MAQHISQPGFLPDVAALKLKEFFQCLEIPHVYLENGKTNPADILSKHWEFHQILPLLKPLLFWRGETAEIKQQPKGSDTNPTDCPSNEPQGNQEDSRLATASSQ